MSPGTWELTKEAAELPAGEETAVLLQGVQVDVPAARRRVVQVRPRHRRGDGHLRRVRAAQRAEALVTTAPARVSVPAMKIEHIGPPTAAELGLMEGSPPPGGRLVTLENWLLAPVRRSDPAS